MLTHQDIKRLQQVKAAVSAAPSSAVFITAAQWRSMERAAKVTEPKLTPDQVERFRALGLL